MNRLPEWNHEDPTCKICGDDHFKEAALKIDDEKHKCLICEKCNSVNMLKGDEVFFMGFLPQARWHNILANPGTPVIRADIKYPVNPSLN